MRSRITQREGQDRVAETEGRVLLRDVAYGIAVALAANLLSFGYRIRVGERALRVELDGYADYCERIPYRLVPRIY